jgi:hypothetical protein
VDPGQNEVTFFRAGYPCPEILIAYGEMQVKQIRKSEVGFHHPSYDIKRSLSNIDCQKIYAFYTE